MHTNPMPDSAGDFSEGKTVDTNCRKCGGRHVVERKWESSCGGYEDYQYTCKDCGFIWWVDGIDS